MNKNLRTGLWLSELTHIYHGAKKQGIEITVASPKGGDTPIDPESLNPLLMDEITKTCWEDSIFKNVLQHTKSLDEVSEFQFDCVYLAGTFTRRTKWIGVKFFGWYREVVELIDITGFASLIVFIAGIITSF